MTSNYATEAVDAIKRELPDVDATLARYYALLAQVRGTAATAQDVHDAWAMWRIDTRPDHPNLAPFADLDEKTQSYDRPYVEGIHRVAQTLRR